jgi:hypothetical protein
MNAGIVDLVWVLKVLTMMSFSLGLLFAPLSLIRALFGVFLTGSPLCGAAAVGLWRLGQGGVVFSYSIDLPDWLALGSPSREFVVDMALFWVGLLTVICGYRLGCRERAKVFSQGVWVLALGKMVGHPLFCFFAA